MDMFDGDVYKRQYGYVVKPLQLESMTIELRNRIWNIYRCEICNDIAVIDSHYLEEIMDACGLSYTSVYDNADLDKNLAVFRKWYDQAEWYRIYDFVEIYLAFLPTKDLSDAIDLSLIHISPAPGHSAWSCWGWCSSPPHG